MGGLRYLRSVAAPYRHLGLRYIPLIATRPAQWGDRAAHFDDFRAQVAQKDSGDEEAMFYLQSRGVSELSAKKMLIKAFVFDILEEIELESFRNYVEELVEEKYKL